MGKSAVAHASDVSEFLMSGFKFHLSSFTLLMLLEAET